MQAARAETRFGRTARFRSPIKDRFAHRPEFGADRTAAIPPSRAARDLPSTTPPSALRPRLRLPQSARLARNAGKVIPWPNRQTGTEVSNQQFANLTTQPSGGVNDENPFTINCRCGARMRRVASRNQRVRARNNRTQALVACRRIRAAPAGQHPQGRRTPERPAREGRRRLPGLDHRARAARPGRVRRRCREAAAGLRDRRRARHLSRRARVDLCLRGPGLPLRPHRFHEQPPRVLRRHLPVPLGLLRMRRTALCRSPGRRSAHVLLQQGPDAPGGLLRRRDREPGRARARG